MSDFEKRLSDALVSGADDAPGAEGLAMSARSRSRRRRRTTVLVAAAAVAAAVAVPVGVVALNDGGSDPVDTATDDTPPASDTRIETWHDVSVEVPASWGHGGRGAWCTGGEVTDAVVERPGTVTPMIACTPSLSYGVTFGSSAAISLAYPSGHVWQYEAGDVAEYAPGTWLGYWYDEDDLVSVAAADKATVQDIIDSVQRVADVDGNGCPVVDEGQVGEPTGDDVSVCRYSAEGDLEQSERLTGEAAAAARAAVEEAPSLGAANDCANPPGEYVALMLGRERADVLYSGNACSDRGLFVGVPPATDGDSASSVDLLQLTEDVMYWALSPGWMGAVESWVPLPDKLRTLPGATTIEREREQQETGACVEQIGPTDVHVTVMAEGPAVLCRYDLSWQGESGGTFMLEDEQEMSTDDEARLVAAIEVAPASHGPSSGTCRDSVGSKGELFVLTRVGETYWIYNTECQLHGVELQRDGQPAVQGRAVTEELLDALGSPYGLLR